MSQKYLLCWFKEMYLKLNLKCLKTSPSQTVTAEVVTLVPTARLSGIL